jgi:hypothetical protein
MGHYRGRGTVSSENVGSVPFTGKRLTSGARLGDVHDREEIYLILLPRSALLGEQSRSRPHFQLIRA